MADGETYEAAVDSLDAREGAGSDLAIQQLA